MELLTCNEEQITRDADVWIVKYLQRNSSIQKTAPVSCVAETLINKQQQTDSPVDKEAKKLSDNQHNDTAQITASEVKSPVSNLQLPTSSNKTTDDNKHDTTTTIDADQPVEHKSIAERRLSMENPWQVLVCTHIDCLDSSNREFRRLKGLLKQNELTTNDLLSAEVDLATSLHLWAITGNEALKSKIQQQHGRNTAALWQHIHELKTYTFEISGYEYPRQLTCLQAAAVHGQRNLFDTIDQCWDQIEAIRGRAHVFEMGKTEKTPLMLAARFNNLNVLSALVTLQPRLYGENGNINATTRAGFTALHYAVCYNHIEAVERLLLAENCDVKSRTNGFLKQPIVFAAALGYVDIVEKIILHCKQKKISNYGLGRALHAAAAGGHDDVIKLLLDADLSLVVEKDEDKNTALLVAAKAGHVDTIKLLIDRRSEIEHRNKKRESVWLLLSQRKHISSKIWEMLRQVDSKEHHIAFIVNCAKDVVTHCNGSLEAFRKRTRGMDVHGITDPNGNTFMHVAASENQFLVLEKFLPEYEDMPSMQNNDGHTPLHIAAKEGHADSIRELLEKPYTVAIVDNRGRTPLHLAAIAGNPIIVGHITMAIWSSGCMKFLHLQDSDGYTALHLAILHGNSSCVQALKSLDPGPIDVRCRCVEERSPGIGRLASNMEHTTPAAEKKISPKTPWYMISNRPNRPKADDRNIVLRKVAVDWANNAQRCLDSFRPNTPVIDRCSKHYGKINSALHLAVLSGKQDVLEQLLKTFYPLSSAKDRTSSAEDDAREVRYDINAKVNSRTALMICVEECRPECFRLLLVHGASLDVRDEDGLTVLHRIVNKSVEGSSERDSMVKIFSIIRNFLKSDMGDEKTLHNLVTKEYSMSLFPLTDNKAQSLTALQLASLKCAVGMLRAFFNSVQVFDDASKSKHTIIYMLKGIIPASMEKTEHSKVVSANHEHSIVFNVEDADQCAETTPPSTAAIPKRKVNPVSDATDKKTSIHSSLSVVEIIANECVEDKIVDVLSIEPLKKVVGRFNIIRSALFMCVLVVHIVHMSCFTVIVLPTCGSNSTLSDRPNAHPFLIFLVWPIVLFVYEIVDIALLLKFLCRRHRAANSGRPKTKHTYFGYKYAIFEILQHLSALGFVALTVVWYVTYVTLKNAQFYTYVKLVSVILVFGWVHSIEYLKGFTSIYAFFTMLKLIFVKDIIRIACIYIFVLIGFATATEAFVLTARLFYGEKASFVDDMYEVFGMMLGMGDLFEHSSSRNDVLRGIDPTTVRLLLIIYICITTVVLLNVLIAMMNETYTSVVGEIRFLHCMESLKFIRWMTLVGACFPRRRRPCSYVIRMLFGCPAKVECNANEEDDEFDAKDRDQRQLREDLTVMAKQIQQISSYIPQFATASKVQKMNEQLRGDTTLRGEADQ